MTTSPPVATDDILKEFPGATALAIGGQKSVFTYTHPAYGSVVLKIGRYRTASSLERIRREVNILRSMNSDAYPHNFEFTVIDRERYLIIEERIGGKPLQEVLSSFSSVERATSLTRDIVGCLLDLWAKKIVHRDLKPLNIMITPLGQPKIIDLGIARLLEESSLTLSAMPRGPCTPIYAAPEQLVNDKDLIDHRADQFILGIVYGQLMLNGGHPFSPDLVGCGDTIVENILQGRVAQSSFAHARYALVRPILFKMLARQPYKRYRDPRQLKADLESILDGASNDQPLPPDGSQP